MMKTPQKPEKLLEIKVYVALGHPNCLGQPNAKEESLFGKLDSEHCKPLRNKGL